MSRRTVLVTIIGSGALVAVLAGCTSDPAQQTQPSQATAPTSAAPVTPTPIPTATAAPATSPAAAPTPTPTCGPSSGAAASASAIAHLPVPSGLDDHHWDATLADYSGYDACAALSWSTVTLDGATASSPYAILLFHEGAYLGTATATQYGFFPTVTRASGSSIAVTYHFPEGGDSNANPTGQAKATFTWNAGTRQVVMTGDTPPAE